MVHVCRAVRTCVTGEYVVLSVLRIVVTCSTKEED